MEAWVGQKAGSGFCHSRIPLCATLHFATTPVQPGLVGLKYALVLKKGHMDTDPAQLGLKYFFSGSLAPLGLKYGLV